MWKFNNNKAKIFNLFNAERDDDHSKSMPSAQLLFSCRTKNAPFEFDHNEIIDKRWSLQNIREREKYKITFAESELCGCRDARFVPFANHLWKSFFCCVFDNNEKQEEGGGGKNNERKQQQAKATTHKKMMRF